MANILELSNQIVDKYLQVSPEYVNIDIIRTKIYNYLLSVDIELATLKDEPYHEIVGALKLIILGQCSIEEETIKEYQCIYGAYDKNVLRKFLTADCKCCNNDNFTFMIQVNETVFTYFINKYTGKYIQ
jgi:hypothetical protein